MAQDIQASFDVIIVGAGLAGSACALTLARNGVRVCVCERGAWPGEKSLSGMILYGRPLADLIPAFWKDAPVERAITRRRFSVLSQDSEVALDLRFEEFNREPHNYTFSVLRSRFDRWFAQQAAEAGATVFTEALVEDLLWEGQQVTGVRLRGGVCLGASVVVSCEGTNAFLVEKAGLGDPAGRATRPVQAASVGAPLGAGGRAGGVRRADDSRRRLLRHSPAGQGRVPGVRERRRVRGRDVLPRGLLDGAALRKAGGGDYPGRSAAGELHRPRPQVVRAASQAESGHQGPAGPAPPLGLVPPEPALLQRVSRSSGRAAAGLLHAV